MINKITFSGNEFLEKNFTQGKQASLKNFTLQCWLKTTEHGPIFEHHSKQNNTYFSIDVTADGKINFITQSDNIQTCLQTISGGINNNAWHYLSVTKKDYDLSIMVNGKEVAAKQGKPINLPNQFVEGLLIGKNLANCLAEKFFTGELTAITIWDYSLSAQENIATHCKEVSDNQDALLLGPIFKDQAKKAVKAAVPTTATITIKNDSPMPLILQPGSVSGNSFLWPAKIEVNQTYTPRCDRGDGFTYHANYVAEIDSELDSDITLYVELHMPSDPAAENGPGSYLKASSSSSLVSDITDQKTTEDVFTATLTLNDMLIVNAKNLNDFINKLTEEGIASDKIITNMTYNEDGTTIATSVEQVAKYNRASLLFNRRIHKKPLAIIKCATARDVEKAYKAAIEFKLPISVRTGGHDHAGESSGTNTILLDLMGLDDISDVTMNNNGRNIVEIGPGHRFLTLTTALAKQGQMLPHGTCATVSIPGFIMGGGWGPWTRKHGMCCESLVAVDIILGDGTLSHVTASSENKDLLWALKGGGGLSYGIVTKFYIQTFDLPQNLIKFELTWNGYDSGQNLPTDGTYPTFDILKRWEAIITATNTPRLTGTNLKINGKNSTVPSDQLTPEALKAEVHNCVMYGYWEGNKVSLQSFIRDKFSGLTPAIKMDDTTGNGTANTSSNYGDNLMGAWDRESYHNVKALLKGHQSSPFPPDLDQPAPHKISCRLVNEGGLDINGDDGHVALIRSLTSPLILEGNRKLGLFNYVTLGAIAGDYYHNSTESENNLSAFPYKTRPYIIQYQTWWNNELAQKLQLQDNDVYQRINTALDWMEVSRDFDIPNTSGSFISFKDDTIPTSTYFAESYSRLKQIKADHSKDEQNHLRSRKTII